MQIEIAYVIIWGLSSGFTTVKANAAANLLTTKNSRTNAIGTIIGSSCNAIRNERADELREAMGKFNLRQREPGKAYIPPVKRNDTEFIKQAQKNYEAAVKGGRV